MGLIKKNGLSLGFGVIHKHHQHHATLASDLMEEWRPIIVDNTLMELIRNGKLLLSHFEIRIKTSYSPMKAEKSLQEHYVQEY